MSNAQLLLLVVGVIAGCSLAIAVKALRTGKHRHDDLERVENAYREAARLTGESAKLRAEAEQQQLRAQAATQILATLGYTEERDSWPVKTHYPGAHKVYRVAFKTPAP